MIPRGPFLQLQFCDMLVLPPLINQLSIWKTKEHPHADMLCIRRTEGRELEKHQGKTCTHKSLYEALLTSYLPKGQAETDGSPFSHT